MLITRIGHSQRLSTANVELKTMQLYCKALQRVLKDKFLHKVNKIKP